MTREASIEGPGNLLFGQHLQSIDLAEMLTETGVGSAACRFGNQSAHIRHDPLPFWCVGTVYLRSCPLLGQRYLHLKEA